MILKKKQNFMEYGKHILVTGGAGFIGSHVVRHFLTKWPDCLVVNLDSLTYAGNLENLRDVENHPNYRFEKADICDYETVLNIILKHDIDTVVHLAAESHVDRSIIDPFTFARTNVMGTLSLLQAARTVWSKKGLFGVGLSDGPEERRCLFHHVSTDEVYGTLGFDGQLFTEHSPYRPHSPYSAGKAGSDHFVRAFHDTYGLPVTVTNCSNNYGPNQFPEKLIPLFINNIRERRPLPVYGDGRNVRDWLYVEDHAEAIGLVVSGGRSGETYNVGGNNEWSNIDLVRLLVKVTDRLLGNPEGTSDSLITFVRDRAGHDLRYAIDSSKLRDELGWRPRFDFESGLERTVAWYLDNQEWLNGVISGEYRNYYRQMYEKR